MPGGNFQNLGTELTTVNEPSQPATARLVRPVNFPRFRSDNSWSAGRSFA
ncbi:hypothetical protein THTE_0657 [Thermogutta terrifontis]|uniref:Uncharacterized protein n=1 Tax=Thermogutta terrifontis TaxID=1331910 RepID=A0A286RBF1_9BACT|nr:hypothetical protein THTE_0657 [Thermogutta terrifontis]